MMTLFSTARSMAATHKTDIQASHPATRIFSDCVVVAGILAIFGIIAYLLPTLNVPIGTTHATTAVSTDPSNLPYYALRSVLRMAIALICSLVFTFIYGLAAARSPRLEKVLIPLLDILQSVPVLGFLSATVTIWLSLFPGSALGVEAASIFAIFTSQAWNMAFSFYRSLSSEPKELDEAVRSLRLTRWQRFWKLDVPHSMIPLLWNMMMSVAGGWFFLTASEVISVGNKRYTLPGIGSFVAQAAAEENLGKVFLAIVTMILVVLVIDVLVWKPLTSWAEKFRITQTGTSMPQRSIVLTVIRQSHVDEWIANLMHPVEDGIDRLMRIFGRTGDHRPISPRRRMAGDLIFNAFVILVSIFGIVSMLITISRTVGFSELGHAFALGGFTFLRVMVLTVFCSLIWVPLGAIIGLHPVVARVVQPIVQIVASFPANFIFPFITMWFVSWNIDINWGSILLMALGSQWYVLFNVIAGASAIPEDLKEMTESLGMKPWTRWKTLILPSILGSWVTGGITAAGGAWNASIVSEIVVYGRHTLEAKGLGTYITQATNNNDGIRIIIGVCVMAIFVVTINRVFWNPLQRLADQRFTPS
jgi:NitT/TauT family transport system permease protein